MLIALKRLRGPPSPRICQGLSDAPRIASPSHLRDPELCTSSRRPQSFTMRLPAINDIQSFVVRLRVSVRTQDSAVAIHRTGEGAFKLAKHECIPFAAVPHSTPLFLDFLNHSSK